MNWSTSMTLLGGASCDRLPTPLTDSNCVQPMPRSAAIIARALIDADGRCARTTTGNGHACKHAEYHRGEKTCEIARFLESVKTQKTWPKTCDEHRTLRVEADATGLRDSHTEIAETHSPNPANR